MPHFHKYVIASKRFPNANTDQVEYNISQVGENWYSSREMFALTSKQITPFRSRASPYDIRHGHDRNDDVN